MITRTIKTTTATVNVFRTETNDLHQKLYVVPTTDVEKAMKFLRKNYETEDIKIVNIISITENEKLFGITEDDFMAHAIELDTETRKPL